MIIKDIAKQGISEIGNIVPLIKNNIIPIKINKTIEIVVVPNLGPKNSHQDNVGIVIEANLMPGLRTGYFYRSCVLNLDMSYEDMIFSIANTGLSSR